VVDEGDGVRIVTADPGIVTADRRRRVKIADLVAKAAIDAERLVAGALIYQPGVLPDTQIAMMRDRDRERIRLVHSALARRRLRALGGRRLS
jgi:hypothetical protein